jgi:alkylation response protein AidB-like acyl-CoA dehydrogenase
MSSPEQQTAASTEPAPRSQDGDEPQVLFSQGTDGPHVDAYRARVRELIAASLWPLVEPAEAERRFPRAAVEAVGGAGLLRERWAGEHGDAGKALIFSEELGRAGLGGIGIGLIVQSDNVIPILRRFGGSGEAQRWLDGVLDGTAIGCVAASELAGGSDLASVQTTALPEGDGWRVRGTKAFSSPAGAADFCLVLCRLEGESFLGPKLGIAIVEKDHFDARPLNTSGCRSLETCRLTIDGQIPAGGLLAPQGLGLHAANWGLTYERLAGAAQALGAAEAAILLATTHLHRRQQFGVPLFEHQALRMRLASLAAELLLARNGLYVLAAKWAKPDQTLIREAAAAKAAAAVLSERVASECAHMFGGAGYLEDETPFPRMLRDMRLARLGGGTNEMMWELYAQGLEVDDELYERMVSIEAPPDSD